MSYEIINDIVNVNVKGGSNKNKKKSSSGKRK